MDIIIQILIPILVSVFTIVGALLGKYITKLITESKTKLDDYLAGKAVQWAEDAFKGEKGEKKLALAIKHLEALTRGKITPVQADTLIRSAYQSLYGELKKLKN